MKKIFILLFFVTAASPAQTVRIMPLGDSITELDWQGGYRGYLYKILSDSGFVFDFVGTKTTNHDDDNLGFAFPQSYWDHEGYNSATITSESGSSWIWNENVDAKLAANPPGVILLLLGTNDLNSSCCAVEEIAGQMDSFLGQIWAYDSTIAVILGSPPPADPARYSRLDGRITEYAALLPALVAEKLSLGRPIALADHHAVMNSGSDLVGDGIHPSPQGYLKMAQVWYDAIASLAVLPTDAADAPAAVPGNYVLMQNYPNPFNPATTIRYVLPVRSHVTLRVFDVLGEEVAVIVDDVQSPGLKEVAWNGTDRPSGVFFYKITAGPFSGTGKMILMK